MLSREDGFTLVEMTVAAVILVSVVLGLSLSAGVLGTISANAEVDAAAMQAVEDRLTLVSLDSRYAALDSLYTGSESTLPSLPGSTRTTQLSHIQTADSAGNKLDYYQITVTVSGGVLHRDFVRTAVIAAP